ncbi:T9SS type A sorting domain-containing protein [Candidatus Uhrbacteria bacterium]|nr:T9SS type A sorting domain-containing protein [Candidatus Uhrbacteria bacterium]
MKTFAMVFTVSVVLGLFAGNALCGDIYFEGWEGGTAAGWVASNPASGITAAAVGGHPGGCLSLQGDSRATVLVGAAVQLPEATGNYGTRGVGLLSFDLWLESGWYNQGWLRLRTGEDDNTGWICGFRVPNEPDGSWLTVMTELDPSWSDSDAKAMGWIRRAGAPSFSEALAGVYAVDILFLAGESVDVRLDNFRLGPPPQCYDNLPPPVLVFEGKRPVGDFLIKWVFSVENWSDYPQELFLSAPEFPTCGANPGQRSTIRFRKASGREIAGVCGVTRPSELQDFGFSGDDIGTPNVYIELVDQQCNVVWRSNTVSTVFVNHRPVVNAGDDRVVECSGPTTPISLDGSLTSDADGDPISFEWLAQGVVFDDSRAPVTVGNFPKGKHAVVLRVSDGFAPSTDIVEIDVVDTTPPDLRVTLDPIESWPPNHKYVDVRASVVANDASGDPATVVLMDITTNGAEKIGKPHPPYVLDAEYGTCDTDFRLLAERTGNGEDREYDIRYLAMDRSSNLIMTTVRICVPHDQSGHAVAGPVSVSAPSRPASLERVYPNPFNPSVALTYSLPKRGFVSLDVFDVNGRLVRRLVSGEMPEGVHTASWNSQDETGARMSSGVYFARFRFEGAAETRKLLLLK